MSCDFNTLRNILIDKNGNTSRGSTFSFLELVIEVKSPDSNDIRIIQESFLKTHSQRIV